MKRLFMYFRASLQDAISTFKIKRKITRIQSVLKTHVLTSDDPKIPSLNSARICIELYSTGATKNLSELKYVFEIAEGITFGLILKRDGTSVKLLTCNGCKVNTPDEVKDNMNTLSEIISNKFYKCERLLVAAWQR